MSDKCSVPHNCSEEDERAQPHCSVSGEERGAGCQPRKRREQAGDRVDPTSEWQEGCLGRTRVLVPAEAQRWVVEGVDGAGVREGCFCFLSLISTRTAEFLAVHMPEFSAVSQPDAQQL